MFSIFLLEGKTRCSTERYLFWKLTIPSIHWSNDHLLYQLVFHGTAFLSLAKLQNVEFSQDWELFWSQRFNSKDSETHQDCFCIALKIVGRKRRKYASFWYLPKSPSSSRISSNFTFLICSSPSSIASTSSSSWELGCLTAEEWLNLASTIFSFDFCLKKGGLV